MLLFFNFRKNVLSLSWCDLSVKRFISMGVKNRGYKTRESYFLI